MCVHIWNLMPLSSSCRVTEEVQLCSASADNDLSVLANPHGAKWQEVEIEQEQKFVHYVNWKKMRD